MNSMWNNSKMALARIESVTERLLLQAARKQPSLF